MISDCVRLSVRNASKSFGKRVLWSDVNLEVVAGEMLALRGASGSGKSTLLNCIGMLDDLDSGVIRIDGADAAKLSGRAVRKLRRESVGYLFQDYALVDDATVAQNLDAAARPRLLQRRRPFAETLESVGLGGRERSKVYELSGGEQQRVALARLLVRPTRLVLADEPTAALDEANAAVVMTLLRHLAESGCAVVIATHQDATASLCEREVGVEAQTLVAIR